MAYDLRPSALRFTGSTDRTQAIDLADEFKRVAQLKIEQLQRPPRSYEKLEWLQLAQHFGLPTKLLDWTESATYALFFACEKHADRDGAVYLINPVDLNRWHDSSTPRILSYERDRSTIDQFIDMQPVERKNGRPPVAINPIWNSARLQTQRGCFTIHGARFSLRPDHATSLLAIPVLREFKASLVSELEHIGVDEMTIYPELEHAANHLKRGLKAASTS